MTFFYGISRDIVFGKAHDEKKKDQKEIRNCYNEPVAHIKPEENDSPEELEDVNDYITQWSSR